MKSQVLIARCDDNGVGLVLENGLDCKTIIKGPNGSPVEPIDYNGIMYLPCNVGDTMMLCYNDKTIRSFKVTGVERSGHFFVCEILFDEEEILEMELLNLAEQVEAEKMTTNMAHLKADQLLVSFLYKKGFPAIADAFNKVPKYYE
jgi:hypothetical protein